MEIVKTDGKQEFLLFERLAARQGEAGAQVTAAVQQIIDAVRAGGDAAVDDYTRRFDGMPFDPQPLMRDQLGELAKACDPSVYAALERAAENIADYHRRQLQQSWMNARSDGTVLGQRVRGLSRVGLYVPGGTAAYPSSVLMNALPARIAGVGELIMVTPPQKNGVSPAVLAAAYIAGVDKVYLCGGAQAVAALAYGTASIPRVDKIVGPGNIYVATAKRLVYGQVDIDMIAGPSEILILADDSADPRWLAADMLSQAEHDPMASAILVTDNEEIARQTAAELEVQVAALSRVEIARRSLDTFGMILICRDMDEGVALANQLAPEHLEVVCREPMAYVGRLDNAGSVFLGAYSPEPLGDYYAGANHVLPTGGTARFFSPLSVDSFLKKSAFIMYNREALQAASADIITLAKAEGLGAHAHSVEIRFE